MVVVRRGGLRYVVGGGGGGEKGCIEICDRWWFGWRAMVVKVGMKDGQNKKKVCDRIRVR